MFDLLSSNFTIQAMDQSMTLATRRMALIASNMANIDTPGYQAQTVSFESALQQAQNTTTGQPQLALAVTDPAHRQDDRKTGALGQPPGRLQLRFVQVVNSQLGQVDAAAQRFHAAKGRLYGFRG